MTEAPDGRERTLAMLNAFAKAWNDHDLDTIMALSTDDCEFWAAAGTEARGGRHVGPAAVAAAYRGIFQTFPDGRWTEGRITLLDGRAISEWLFVGNTPDGRHVEVLGIDVLELVGDKVRIKNTYRKTRL